VTSHGREACGCGVRSLTERPSVGVCGQYARIVHHWRVPLPLAPCPWVAVAGCQAGVDRSAHLRRGKPEVLMELGRL
jgi:hypothetical protein